jgi:hydroxylaminobenzene mutase
VNPSALLARQGNRLLQIGILLLLFVSFEGFAIPDLAAPHLGLAAHRLGSLQSVLLLVLGLVWPRLNLSEMSSRLACWLLVYSALAILAAYTMAAIWGAGNMTLVLTAGTAHGSPFQETMIKVIAYSSAPTGIVSFGLICLA